MFGYVGLGGLGGIPVLVGDPWMDDGPFVLEVPMQVGYAPGLAGYSPFGLAGPGIPAVGLHPALLPTSPRLSPRLGDRSRTMTLYHETDQQSALSILSSQKMLRGNSGLAGGGIYFAESPLEARQKANSHGVLLSAQVRVGRCKEVHRQTDANFQDLRAEGYDSVKILGRATGIEYVVYSCEQVSNIRQI